MEAGTKYPGSAGLTSDRFGDAGMWQPASHSTDGAGMEKNGSPTGWFGSMYESIATSSLVV